MSSTKSAPDGDSHTAWYRRLADEIHVWLARMDALTDRARQQADMQILSVDELARYRAFHFDRDRARYLVSHALVRRALSHYAGVEPAAWRFESGEHGKPRIIAPVLSEQLEFNLSHTAGLAACLVTRGCACGVDVEFCSDKRDMSGIARRMFAARELEQLGRLDGDAYRDQFFVFWTLREAYAKALGTGLAHIGREIGFRAVDEGCYSVCAGADFAASSTGVLTVLRPTEQHVLTVALLDAGSPERKLVCHWLEP